MSRRIPPTVPAAARPSNTSPPNLAPPSNLQCYTCKTKWTYTESIAGPGGSIGILFHLQFLGCPVCNTIQPYGPPQQAAP